MAVSYLYVKLKLLMNYRIHSKFEKKKKETKKITTKKSAWLVQNLYTAKIDDCCYLDFMLLDLFT